MRKLVIFNLRTDPDSSVLGASIDWIVEFRNHFIVTDVVSTHVGINANLQGVRTLEIGGGSLRARLKALIRLLKFALELIPKRTEYLVFHHMSPRTAVFPGTLFKMFGIPQALWYSHSSRPLSLALAERTVDWIFSSEKNSFPFDTPKAHFVGHGISLKRFGTLESNSHRENSILFIGRISRIKNLSYLIDEVASLDREFPLILIGPHPDFEYVRELRAQASERNVQMVISDSISYDNVHEVMKKYKYFYSGMKNSVDKSALEASISGCLVLTTDVGTQELSGMKRAWQTITPTAITEVRNQIKALESLSRKELDDFREIVRREAMLQNSLEKTISQISLIMKVSK